MQRIDHPLLSPSLGSHKTLGSFHFGTVAEVMDPIANQSQRMVAGVAGTLYVRIRDRYVTTGSLLGD